MLHKQQDSVSLAQIGCQAKSLQLRRVTKITTDFTMFTLEHSHSCDTYIKHDVFAAVALEPAVPRLQLLLPLGQSRPGDLYQDRLGQLAQLCLLLKLEKIFCHKN